MGIYSYLYLLLVVAVTVTGILWLSWRYRQSKTTRPFAAYGSPTQMVRVCDARCIWMYWDTGVDQAPPYCRECFDAWRRFNPGRSVHVLDSESAAELLPEWASLCALQNRRVQHEADLLRIMLLHKFGGVWADARILPVAPLDAWLNRDLAPAGFFAFSWEPGKHGRLTTANWFLATDQPEHPLIVKWSNSFKHAWRSEGAWTGPKNDNTGTYFRQHQLLTDLVASDSEVRDCISRMPFRHTFLGRDSTLQPQRLMYKNHVTFDRRKLEDLLTATSNSRGKQVRFDDKNLS